VLAAFDAVGPSCVRGWVPAAGRSATACRRTSVATPPPRHLERDVTAVADDLRADLDEFLAQAGQQPRWCGRGGTARGPPIPIIGATRSPRWVAANDRSPPRADIRRGTKRHLWTTPSKQERSDLIHSLPTHGPGHDHIGLPSAASGTDEPLAPIENAGVGALPSSHLCRVRLDLMLARLAPHDKPDLGSGSATERHRRACCYFIARCSTCYL